MEASAVSPQPSAPKAKEKDEPYVSKPTGFAYFFIPCIVWENQKQNQHLSSVMAVKEAETRVVR